MSSVPFSHLEAFLAVARLRSFTAAGRELGVSRSAVSQSIRQLEEHLRVVLVARTTRSVSLTDAGRRLLESAGPAVRQTLAALTEVAAKPGEISGRVRLSVPRAALPFIIEPVLPAFHARHPQIEVDIAVEERFVDLVAEGYDAGVRLSEAIERDMVQVRLTESFRFVIGGAPRYQKERGTPHHPKDLLQHQCLTFRSQTTGALYAWELERGRKSWRIPVRGSIVSNDSTLAAALAERGVGLAYAFEPRVKDAIAAGRLVRVLEPYAVTVPGFFLYFQSRSQSSAPLRLFVDMAKEILLRKRKT